MSGRHLLEPAGWQNLHEGRWLLFVCAHSWPGQARSSQAKLARGKCDQFQGIGLKQGRRRGRANNSIVTILSLARCARPSETPIRKQAEFTGLKKVPRCRSREGVMRWDSPLLAGKILAKEARENNHKAQNHRARLFAWSACNYFNYFEQNKGSRCGRGGERGEEALGRVTGRQSASSEGCVFASQFALLQTTSFETIAVL